MREVALKPLLEERCQPKADGVVTEFGANSNSREQTSSQEKNWIATASAKPRNDGSVKQGLLQGTLDYSGSVTPQSLRDSSSSSYHLLWLLHAALLSAASSGAFRKSYQR